MLFPTVEYAAFFILVLGLSWLLSSRLSLHKGFLLLASYTFYGFWSWRYVPLLFILSLVAGVLARTIQRSDSERTRKQLLVIGVVLFLATLAYYKYLSFLLLTTFNLWRLIGRAPVWNFPSQFLPLGISFFTFHAISLLGDVYRRKLKQPVTLLDSLLYVAFFPQLIAGPILRASYFFPQLAKRRDRRHIRMNQALLLIVGGLFKKVIVSNMLSTRVVEPVFASPMDFARPDVLLAIYAYAAQIYCDFSGYTDIATGCAMLLGYHFPKNFDAPYTAANPQEFWHRWHISLSRWLQTYLYIPLGGSRGGTARTYLNLMITMLLGGLWHGASWSFVIWGGLQGLYLVVHRLWASWENPQVLRLREQKAWPWVSRLLLFHAVCLGWVFFRSPTLGAVGAVLSRLAVPGAATLCTLPVMFVLLWGLFGQYLPVRALGAVEAGLARLPAPVGGVAFAIAVYAIDLLGPTGVAPFIYFQF